MQYLILFAALAVLFAFMVPSAARFMRGAGLAFALMVLAVVPATAQTVGDVVTDVTPLLLQLLSVILMAVLTWAATWAKTKFSVDIEAKHRESLHSALMTAARLAAAKQMTSQTAMALILDYVRKSVPDALASLKPSPVVLQELAESKLREALAEGLGNALTR